MLFVLICPITPFASPLYGRKWEQLGKWFCWLSMLWTLTMNGLDLGPVGVALASPIARACTKTLEGLLC